MPPAPHRDFLGYLQSLGPLIAACVAVGVGTTQWVLQKQHQKQNLYEKRWKVYRSIPTYWRNLVENKGEPPLEARQQLLTELSHATFLFGPEVVEFLERVLCGDGRILQRF